MGPFVLFGLANPVGATAAVPALPPVALPPASPSLAISGVSRDASGVTLAGATCTLFRVDTDVNGVKTYTQIMQVVSDANGAYSFPVGPAENYRVTFDLGSPVLAGVTLDTLAGA